MYGDRGEATVSSFGWKSLGKALRWWRREGIARPLPILEQARQCGPLTLAEALDAQMELEATACRPGTDPQPSEHLVSLAQLYEQQCRVLAEDNDGMLPARSRPKEQHSLPTLTATL